MKQALRSLAIAAFAIAAIHTQTKAQCDPPALRFDSAQYIFDGNVFATTQSGNTLYVGGNFTTVGKYCGGFVAVDTTAAHVKNLNNWPKVYGSVNSFIADGNGGWFIGGSFTKVGNTLRNNLAQIDANGQVTAWNPNVTGTVSTLLKADNKVYIGGAGLMSAVGGQTRISIAAVDAATGSVLPWYPSLNGGVISTMAVAGNNLYIGGSITNTGSVHKNLMAIDTATGIVTSWNPMVSGSVYTMAISDTLMYIGGSFTSAGGQPRMYIAAISRNSGLATSWDASANKIVNSILLNGSNMYVGGNFTAIGSQARLALAEVSLATGDATSWEGFTFTNGGTPTATVSSIKLYGDQLYLVGTFDRVQSLPRKNFTVVNIPSDTITSLSVDANQGINYAELNGSTLYMGGSFNVVDRKPRKYIAALDMISDTIISWNPVVAKAVRALAADPYQVYAGNDKITTIAAVPTGHSDIKWTTLTQGSATVNTMALYGNTLYEGGENRLGAYNIVTGAKLLWVPGVAGAPSSGYSVGKLIPYGGSIYIGGTFVTVGGTARKNIVAVDTINGVATSWNTVADGGVSSMSLNNGLLYVGGSFNNIGGQLRPRLAAIDPNTGAATSWNPHPNDAVSYVATNGSTTYAFGSFTSIGKTAVSRNKFALLDTGAVVGSWNPAFSAVNSMEFFGNQLYITGPTGTTAEGVAVSYMLQYSNFTDRPSVTISGTSTICGTPRSDTFTAASLVTGASYQWLVNNTPMGTNSPVYSYTPANNDQVSCIITSPANPCFTSLSDTSNVITVSYGPASTNPSVVVTGDTSLCIGVPVTYSASSSVSGAAYQWVVNNTNMPGADSAKYTYTGTGATAATIKCVITAPHNVCYSSLSAMDSLNINVHSSVTPNVSLYSTKGEKICTGDSTIFETAANNIVGGHYQWQVNGGNVGTDTSYYGYKPVNNDKVNLVVTAPNQCYSPSIASSDTILMAVDTYTTPHIHIITTPDTICKGDQVAYTYTSNIIPAYTITWYLNNNGTSEKGPNYYYNAADTDKVYLFATLPQGCYTTGSYIFSDTASVYVKNYQPAISISAPASVKVGNTVTVNATVTNMASYPIADYKIDWTNNNSFLATTTVPVVTYTKGIGTDLIAATVTVQDCDHAKSFSNDVSINADLGIDNLNAANKISAYPNPFTNEITLSNLQTGDKFCLYDIMGRKVSPDQQATQTQNEQSFKINALPVGSYMLHITDKDGNVKGDIPLQKR